MIGALSAKGICAASAHYINARASAFCSEALHRLHMKAVATLLSLHLSMNGFQTVTPQGGTRHGTDQFTSLRDGNTS